MEDDRIDKQRAAADDCRARHGGDTAPTPDNWMAFEHFGDRVFRKETPLTDEERAEQYEQAQDDPKVWTELDDAFHVPAHARSRGGLSSTVTVRFDPSDAAKLRELAERLQLSYSDVIREAVRQIVEPRFVIDTEHSHVTYSSLISFGVPVGKTPALNSLVARVSATTTESCYEYQPSSSLLG